MLYTLRFFFSSKCSLFHNANLFGSCIIHILDTGCAKIKKKNNSGTKGLIKVINCRPEVIFGLRTFRSSLEVRHVYRQIPPLLICHAGREGE